MLKINSLSSRQSLVPNMINKSNLDNNFEVESQDSSELLKMKQLVYSDAPKAANSQTNSINIKPGEIKNIGNIEGYPLNISFDANGMMSTSFSIPIHSSVGAVTPEDMFAANVASSYTPAQINKANSIVSRFQLLNSVANGTMSVNQYNSTDFGQNTMSTSELLTSLGIDVSKSFSFNGKSFYLDNQGNLHASLPASQLNAIQ
ncbi:hypothetical protein [Desulfosporosinus sp. FKA]|uniref:hypothetical protein n=1 Tax=Desulfosporosinus sp. FKA TaxID=1969834 RepID=UPI001124EE45|nr:hypothetical protein [Desulfosporosinus sp. FKA]